MAPVHVLVTLVLHMLPQVMLFKQQVPRSAPVTTVVPFEHTPAPVHGHVSSTPPPSVAAPPSGSAPVENDGPFEHTAPAMPLAL
jgi:hypothetical protein